MVLFLRTNIAIGGIHANRRICAHHPGVAGKRQCNARTECPTTERSRLRAPRIGCSMRLLRYLGKIPGNGAGRRESVRAVGSSGDLLSRRGSVSTENQKDGYRPQMDRPSGSACPRASCRRRTLSVHGHRRSRAQTSQRQRTTSEGTPRSVARRLLHHCNSLFSFLIGYFHTSHKVFQIHFDTMQPICLR